MLHLSRKCGESVPGGRYDDATCHGNAGKVCQVDGAIAGLELPDRNIAYLNLPDRNITYLKLPTGKLHVWNFRQKIAGRDILVR